MWVKSSLTGSLPDTLADRCVMAVVVTARQAADAYFCLRHIAILNVERYSPRNTRRARRHFCIHLILRELRGKGLLRFLHFIGTLIIAIRHTWMYLRLFPEDISDDSDDFVDVE